ncbi:hypothetical protein GPECTOR_2g1580 [Gonium pectorale]|uniref:Uncharacterized protein n=1 Tax=Gonium pectorale TaxID=33097 RepID=A0A150H2G1_GONPE|nr:hypothetical protein GPECTOR_2g1580 [Gonium pectorale]|eukprot:KXZ56028.1 hypothetical protein GPECTOR_2g1580 [Gonium pectorale]
MEVFKRAEELFASQLAGAAADWQLYTLELQGNIIFSRDHDSGPDGAHLNAFELLHRAGEAEVITAGVRSTAKGPVAMHVGLRGNAAGPCLVRLYLTGPTLGAAGATVGDLAAAGVHKMRSKFHAVKERGALAAFLLDLRHGEHVRLSLSDAISDALRPGNAIFLEGVSCSGLARSADGSVGRLVAEPVAVKGLSSPPLPADTSSSCTSMSVTFMSEADSSSSSLKAASFPAAGEPSSSALDAALTATATEAAAAAAADPAAAAAKQRMSNDGRRTEPSPSFLVASLAAAGSPGAAIASTMAPCGSRSDGASDTAWPLRVSLRASTSAVVAQSPSSGRLADWSRPESLTGLTFVPAKSLRRDVPLTSRSPLGASSRLGG